MKTTSRNFWGLLAIASVSVTLAAGTMANCFWNAPVTYQDGSALPAGDIDHYTLTWAPASGQAGPSGSLNVPAGTLSAPVNVPCGATTFTVTVTTNATAKYPNSTSGPSSAVPYATGVQCAANPPGGLAVH